MTRYMLDTNTLSYLVQGRPAVTERVVAVPMAALCMSSITEGELLYGLAKRPAARKLHAVVHELLLRLDVLPWDHAAAERYGATRAEMAAQGKVLAPLDLLIATHALSVGAVLVTSDKAFTQVPGLLMESWAK